MDDIDNERGLVANKGRCRLTSSGSCVLRRKRIRTGHYDQLEIGSLERPQTMFVSRSACAHVVAWMILRYADL